MHRTRWKIRHRPQARRSYTPATPAGGPGNPPSLSCDCQHGAEVSGRDAVLGAEVTARTGRSADHRHAGVQGVSGSRGGEIGVRGLPVNPLLTIPPVQVLRRLLRSDGLVVPRGAGSR